MNVDARRVPERRRTEQRALVERAERFAGALDANLRPSAVVVLGSVARGDFNLWSDTYVLVVLAQADDRTVGAASPLLDGDPPCAGGPPR